MTHPRQAIVEVLSSTADHLSAEEVFARVRKRLPACGLMTVYRTLELLMDLGIVTGRDFGEGKRRHELSEGHGKKVHHHHLICRGCHRVVDYNGFAQDELAFIKKAEEGLSKQYDFKIEEHDIGFRGLCAACQ